MLRCTLALCLLVAFCPAWSAPAPTTLPSQSITIKAVDEKGQPIPGVRLRVSMVEDFAGGGAEGTTGPDGTWTFAARPDAACNLIGAAAPGRRFVVGASGDFQALPHAGCPAINPRKLPNAQVTLRCAPGDSRLTGKIIDAQGQPVAGADVLITSPRIAPIAAWVLLPTGLGQLSGPVTPDPTNPLWTVSDDKGNYSIMVPVGTYEVSLVIPPAGKLLHCAWPANGYRFAGPGGNGQFSSLMLPAGGLDLVVTDPQGKPVVGATVDLLEVRDGKVPGIRAGKGSRQSTATDAKGLWQATGLPAGSVVARVVPPPGMAVADGKTDPVEIVVGQVTQATVQLAPEAVVEGVVKDTTGKPIPGVRVYNKVVTDEQGRYVIGGLSAGPLTLLLNSSADPLIKPPTTQERQLEIKPGERQTHDAVLERHPPATLTVSVTNSAGKPLPGVRVSPRVERSDGGWWHTPPAQTSGDDGNCRFDNLPPGKARCFLSNPPAALSGLNVVVCDVPPGGNVTGSFSVPASHLVRLQVTGTDGKPAANTGLGYWIETKRDEAGSSAVGSTVSTDDMGRATFFVPLAGKGWTTVSFHNSDGGPWPGGGPIIIGPDSDDVIDHELTLGPGATLDLTVKDDAGKPIPMVNISISRGTSPNFALNSRLAAIRTDADGRLTVPYLMPGDCQFQLEAPMGDTRDLRMPPMTTVKLVNKETLARTVIVPRSGTITGCILAPDGKRVAASITARDGQGKMFWGTAASLEQDMIYRIGRLPPGTYKLTAALTWPEDRKTYGDLAGSVEDVVVKLGETVSVDVQLKAEK